MRMKEIDEDISKKKRILAWLIKHDIRDLRNFGKMLDLYYKDREFLFKIIQKDDPKEILKE